MQPIYRTQSGPSVAQVQTLTDMIAAIVKEHNLDGGTFLWSGEVYKEPHNINFPFRSHIVYILWQRFMYMSQH